MDFMPLIPFLGVSLPESLVLYYMIFTLIGKKVSFRTITVLAMATSICSYFIRSLPIDFGVHFILQMLVMIILLIIFCRLYWQTVIIAMLCVGIVFGLTESAMLYILAWSFSITLSEIVSDPLLRIVFALPYLLLLSGLTYVVSKRKWSILPVKESPLLKLCLVQAFMLVLLISSFYAYSSGAYPSFTIDTLITVSIVVILISILATVLVALYLVKAVEKEVKLEADLYHAAEKDKLNMKIKVERHDFYNHITAIYGYMKAKEYDLHQKYIEKRFKHVLYIKSLLDVGSVELSALISVKQEKARESDIAFHWQVNITTKTLPISPEDLIQLLGNLLDNALDAAAKGSSAMKKVDLEINCNNLGMVLHIANTGNPITPEVREKIFTAGYSTKEHGGLGLYIVNEIIQRLDIHMELKEPEDYPGVLFMIYIPWNK